VVSSFNPIKKIGVKWENFAPSRVEKKNIRKPSPQKNLIWPNEIIHLALDFPEIFRGFPLRGKHPIHLPLFSLRRSKKMRNFRSKSWRFWPRAPKKYD